MQITPDGCPDETTEEANAALPPASLASSSLEWASFPGSSGLVEQLGGTDAYMRFIRPGYDGADDGDDDGGPPGQTQSRPPE